MSIDTTLRLNDGMTGVINSMISALSAFTSGLHNVQSVLGSNIDTRMFDEAVRSSQEALAKMALVEKQVQQTQKAFQWQVNSSNYVYQNTGLERLNIEMRSMLNMSDDIARKQRQISNQMSNTKLIPSHAITDINVANSRMQSLLNIMSSFKNIDISILNQNDVSYMNNAVEKMRQMEREILNSYSNMQKNLESGNLEGLNTALNIFIKLTQQAEMHIRDMNELLNQANNFKWNNNNFQIFNSDGLERAKQEILSAKNLTEKLIQTQQKLTEKSANMKLITPNAITDINNLNNRILNLQDTMNSLEKQKNILSNSDIAGINKYNAQIENIRRSLSAILAEQERRNSALQSNNIQQVNESYQRLYNLINEIESSIRNNTEAQNQFNQSLARSNSKCYFTIDTSIRKRNSTRTRI